MHELDWNNLRVVLAISRSGSLTAAAKVLGLDQTTAGRRLTALEDSVGAALFRRAKSGFVATEAGETVVAEARVVEQRLAAMADRLTPDRAANEGIVRILGNGWMLARLAEYALPGLLAEHPGLEIRFANRLPPTPVYGEPTVALWFDAAARAPDRTQPIARVPYAAYRARGAAASDDWVMFRDDDATGPSFTREARRRLGPDARVRMTGTDATILAAAVRGGVGHGILPTCLGDPDPALERAETQPGRIERVLYLHTSPEFAGRLRVETVLGWLGPALVSTLDATPMT